jgi:hypothetical protein
MVTMAEEIQSTASYREPLISGGSLQEFRAGAHEQALGKKPKASCVVARSARLDKMIQVRSSRHLCNLSIRGSPHSIN